MSTTILDFIRHGEPVGGRKYRGQIDDPLSDRGWSQMRNALGENKPWSRIISSPLSRCRAFSEELSSRHGLPLDFDERLKEVGFGVWEGKTASELNEEDPQQLPRFKSDPANARPQGAEPLSDFYTRVAAGVDSLLEKHPGEHILIVCHAGVIRMALAHGLQIPLVNAYRIDVPSAGVTRMTYEGSLPHVVLRFHGRKTLEAD